MLRPRDWLRSSITPETRPAHQAILRHFAATGGAPDHDALAAALGVEADAVRGMLRQLRDAGAISLDADTGRITSAYPFSALPTPHRIALSDGVTAFGMCAVDALGVAAMFGRSVQIESPCAHCGTPILLRASPAAAVSRPDGAVVWYAAEGGCAQINFFCSAEHAQAWQAGRPEVEGEIWPLERAAARGREVFRGLLTNRLLLLVSANSYRARAFLQAAQRLGVEVVRGVDAPGPMAGVRSGVGDAGPGARLALDFRDPEKSTRTIAEFARSHPLQAVLPIDDGGTVLAAHVSAALGLPFNSVEAAWAARDKHRMRQLLSAAGVPSPQFALCRTSDDLESIAAEVHYPCVVKPRYLSGSRGVIRADDAEGFLAAVERLSRVLNDNGPAEFLVEQFISGVEVALEGMLTHGALKMLALFDKPDPLDGPFFEETIYTTPSRLPADVQAAIVETAARAARALGLREGPIHAELRVNADGPWVIEVAGRSIGGLCSKTLRFGGSVSEEELILRQAFGMPADSFEREAGAGGVMMIPIPAAGILAGVSGCEDAERVPGIESVEITAKFNYPIQPLPEGDSYLGFIFARGGTPEGVEAALRQAHQRLKIEIVPEIPVLTGP